MRKKRIQKKLDNLSEKEKLVVKYFRDFAKERKAYPSDIAEYYDWKFLETLQICQNLETKGILY